MRISDWSSDVCSSDLSQLCATSGLQTVKRLDNDAFDIVGRGDPGVWIAARAGQFRGMPNIGLRHSQTSKRLLWARFPAKIVKRSEEHTSELQSLMRISYAVFCLKKKKQHRIRQQQIQ